MALDLLSCVFQLCMLSDFSSSMLVEFPRIRLCQKVLIKLMRCMDQYNLGGGGGGCIVELFSPQV